MTSRNARPWRDVTIVIAVVAAALTIILWPYIAAEWHAREAEREVTTFANSISIGATRNSVTEIFTRGNFRHLTRSLHLFDSQWVFNTPSRIGASDWVLIVGFEDERVISIRVATADNFSRRPDGAPADRGLTLPLADSSAKSLGKSAGN